MLYLVLSVACSVAVSVMLKLLRRHQLDVAQAITWNYLAASLLCLGLLQPSLTSLTAEGTPWGPLLALAALLPSLFLVMAAAVREAGIVRSDIAQRLSLLLSLAAAFLWFHEPLDFHKALGMGLGLLAVVGLLARPEPQASRGAGAGWLLLLVWVGYALVDVLLKSISIAGTGTPSALLVTFSLAFVGMLGGQWRRARRFHWRSGVAGLLLGTLNFGNILFYIQAHRALPSSPAVVFAAMNLGVVLTGTLVGTLVFRERTSLVNRLAIALAVAAILLVASSLHQ